MGSNLEGKPINLVSVVKLYFSNNKCLALTILENSKTSNVKEVSGEQRNETDRNGTDSSGLDCACRKDLKEIYRNLEDLNVTKVRY